MPEEETMQDSLEVQPHSVFLQSLPNVQTNLRANTLSFYSQKITFTKKWGLAMKIATKLSFAACVLVLIGTSMGCAMAAQSDYLGVAVGNSWNWTYSVAGSNIATSSCTIGLTVIAIPPEIATNQSLIVCNATSTNDTLFNATMWNENGGFNNTITSMADASYSLTNDNMLFAAFIATNAQNMSYNPGVITVGSNMMWVNTTYDSSGVLEIMSFWTLTNGNWFLLYVSRTQGIAGYPTLAIIGLAGLAVVLLGRRRMSFVKQV
jgi:hypothetical protein